MSADPVAELQEWFQEAHFDPWESVSAALAQVSGQPHPRVAWLVTHLSSTKRGYWQLLAEQVGCPSPPPDAGLSRLMEWEAQALAQLSAADLAQPMEYEGRQLTASALLRLNIRHSIWHAGQIAALAQRQVVT